MESGAVRKALLNRVVLVCALGNLVDAYDLVIFIVVRRASLADLGVAQADMLDAGTMLLTWQLLGLLAGGILWGVLGDRRGRRSILFGSIALYSLATLANAFVQDLGVYAALRFAAGVGLAGELGAGVTLVSEVLPAGIRGLGTMVMVVVGNVGVLAAVLVARVDWRTTYLVGGLLGLALLTTRLGIRESSIFQRTAQRSASRGDLRLFLGTPSAGGMRWFRGNGHRLRLLGALALVGIPLWYANGVLAAFVPEIGAALHLTGPVDIGLVLLLNAPAAILGGLACGLFSQKVRRRRLAVLWFLIILAGAGGSLFATAWSSPVAFYAVAMLFAFGGGYAVVYYQSIAEMFGTDLRATVTTAVPNLLRASAIPLTLVFALLSRTMNVASVAILLLTVTVAIAFVAQWRLPETFGRDLAFEEANARTTPSPESGPGGLAGKPPTPWPA